MNRPFVPTEESASGLLVSMVTDEAILWEEVALGCNHCYNGLSYRDQADPANADYFNGWQDLGDDGVLCPACARRCRVCGCTDEDCSGCIARTGEPCHWVEGDLCSACVPPKEVTVG